MATDSGVDGIELESRGSQQNSNVPLVTKVAITTTPSPSTATVVAIKASHSTTPPATPPPSPLSLRTTPPTSVPTTPAPPMLANAAATIVTIPAPATNTTKITINNQAYDEVRDSQVNAATGYATASASTANNANIILPALPSTSRQLFRDAAAAHGGDESTNLLKHELVASQQQMQQQLMQQHQRNRTMSSTLDATVSRNPSTTGKHEKKIGHRRVDEGGEVTYKKIQSKQIMGSIQLGIQHTVGSLASKPKRDLLMNDFWEMETISFPPDGSSITPAHHYSDFRFKVYAPIAFRYFRDLFGIAPDDFLMSICAAPLRQLSNPGASGSIFYLTDDDEFIIKTVQKKECEFLQKLLPGYYMNLSQNPRTLLPKFFGLYCFHYNTKNVRLVAMNNLLPSDIKMHSKYDLKGSTFRRKASKVERQKASPTYKDLDFMEHHPNGVFLETDKYNALMKTIQRDCMVLESFQIMDYSLLMGVHNLDLAQKEKREERIRNARAKLQRTDETRDHEDGFDLDHAYNMATPSSSTLQQQQSQAAGTALNRTRSMNRQRLVAHSTAMESITADMDALLEEDEDMPAGGIPARSENDERLILYIGIIDILQSYRLEKKLEHTFKSIIYNGDTVSVCRPSFYAQRFQNFMGKTVFKKTPTFPLKHSPSKRKTSTTTMRTPLRTPSQSITSQVRPTLVTGSLTPPPAFDDISEEDLTVTASSTSGLSRSAGRAPQQRNFGRQRSRLSSNRSVLSNTTTEGGDYSDDDIASSSSVARSPQMRRTPHSPRLSMTSVQLTTIGCVEDAGTQVEEVDKREIGLSPINSTIIVTGDADPTATNGTMTSNDDENVMPNGKVIVSTPKTMLVEPGQSKTYTSTLVVNDIAR